MATVIISLLLLVLVVFAVRYLWKENSCGGSCGSCSKGCMHGHDLYEAYQKGEKQNA